MEWKKSLTNHDHSMEGKKGQDAECSAIELASISDANNHIEQPRFLSHIFITYFTLLEK